MYEIPLTQTTLGEEEAEAAARVVRSKWLTMGAEVAAFEEEFAAALDARHAVAVDNGTAALEIAYQACGIAPGDEVILPAITFVACSNALIRAGATPILADICGADDLTISPTNVEKKITAKTRAIVSMPYGGFCPDMNELSAIAARHNLTLIEDACHAPLAELDGRKIGTFGAAATWSFFGNKNMTTGEGGMITTDDAALAERCRLIRSHGMTKSSWDRARGHAHQYDVAEVGINARMDEIRAAIGRVQLRKLPGATRRRAANAGMLREMLNALSLDGLTIPFAQPRGTSAHHLFVVVLPEGSDRATIMGRMKERGVQTSIHYPPIDSFSKWRELFPGPPADLPVTRAVAGRLLTLPLGPEMTEDMCARIAEALQAALT